MSDKILGRICFEAWEPGGDWDDQDESLQEDFENGAQAVVAHLIADMSSTENEAVFGAIQELLFAKERARLAKILIERARVARETIELLGGSEPPGMHHMASIDVAMANWLRKGGKP